MAEEEERESEVIWEGFLPRMFLRVLLVEADDSTRQIISALLRKCSYKVAAVADGLRAWETLKEKSHYIDLVLTEVDLPSVSGFCLLSKIMEHDTCKNIPVIMMSSHDSISMVFKFMLKGAADFLIKPIRKNELRNLWQHVWRRQPTSGVRQAQNDDNLPQRKLDAVSENNAASNHSSDNVAPVQKTRECSVKGSDTLSSCGKADMEAESAYVPNTRELFVSSSYAASHLNDKALKSDDVKPDEPTRLGSKVTPLSHKLDFIDVVIEGKPCDKDPILYKHPIDDNYEKPVKPCREAVDLIGAIQNQLECSSSHAEQTYAPGGENAKNHLDESDNLSMISSLPFLELSLRRSPPIGCQNHQIEETHTLNHSSASAFSWYHNRTIQLNLPPSMSNCTGARECTSIGSHKHLANHGTVNASDSPQVGVVPPPVPIRGKGFHNPCLGYSSVPPPVFYAQSGPPVWNTNSTNQEEGVHDNSPLESNQEIHSCEKNGHLDDHNASNPIHKLVPRQEQLENSEDPKNATSFTCQNGSSGVCSGNKLHPNSSGYESVCDTSNRNGTASAATATAKSWTEEGMLANDESGVVSCSRSSQREAALIKFRLKRKERCFEKKVRYQSRKKLAEQRPRVKGQFVRQA